MITRESYNNNGNFAPELHLAKMEPDAIYEYEIRCRPSLHPLSKILDKIGFHDILFKETLNSHDYTYYESDDYECIVAIASFNGQYSLDVFYTEKYQFDKLKRAIDKHKVKDEDSKKNKVHFIVQHSSGMELMEKELKLLDVHIEDYELSLPFEKIQEEIKKDKSGLRHDAINKEILIPK